MSKGVDIVRKVETDMPYPESLRLFVREAVTYEVLATNTAFGITSDRKLEDIEEKLRVSRKLVLDMWSVLSLCNALGDAVSDAAKDLKS